MLFINPQKTLPSTYIRCDYLETIGYNTRIDTGIAGDDNTLQFMGEIELFTFVGYATLFGNYINADYKGWRLILSDKETTNYFICGTHNVLNTVVYVPATTYSDDLPCKFSFLIQYQYGEIIINDQKYTRTNTNDDGKLENTNNIAIGSPNTSLGGTTQFDKNRFYSFKIYKQGKLVRNYKPCIRKSDNKPGFYDLVNQTFNPSIGSQDFIAGND